MPAKFHQADHPWTVLGAPQGGTISALAIVQDSDGYNLYIASPTGLYHSSALNAGRFQEWTRLVNAPLGIMALAVSPSFSEDHTILAGTHTGVYLSHNGGGDWRAAQMPSSTSMILTLGYSPDYQQDGTIFAGTLEDGVFISNDRGERWFSQSFGLLDPTVYSLAISPQFAQDGQIFVGTETAIYSSYNAGRAWRALTFPKDDASILSLALLTGANSVLDLFAGTETHGLYRSLDLGESWQPMEISAETINALTAVPGLETLVAATEIGVMQSTDEGNTWQFLLEMADAMTVATASGLIVAGVGDQGAWGTDGKSQWQPTQNLPMRSLLGMALSAHFEKDGTAYLYGPEEGIWKTTDGGRTWADLGESLPSLEINALQLSPFFDEDGLLWSASNNGLLISHDAGQTWNTQTADPCRLLAISPNGKVLACAFPGQGLRFSEDRGQSWQDLPGPWDSLGGKFLALAVTNLRQFFVAHLEGIGEILTLWQGKAGGFEKVFSEPAGDNPHVCFWLPTGAASERPWYASLGSQVWKISGRTGSAYTQINLELENAPTEPILALSGMQDPEGRVILFACTGQAVYRTENTKSWTAVHDFGDARAIAFILSPDYKKDQSAYTLLLGGMFCKLML